MAGFPTGVTIDYAPAVEGLRATQNPASLVVAAGPYGIQANAAGVTIGRFAWVPDRVTAYSYGQGVPSGIVLNEQNAQIAVWNAQSSMVIMPGYPMSVFSKIDIWVKTLTTATVGQKAFANMLDGSVSTAAAGATIQSASVTASIATNVLTVTAVGSGALAVGALIAGASVPANSYIATQASGTPGGIGTYTLTTTPGTVTSATVTATNHYETPFTVQRAGAANELIIIGQV